MQSTFWHNKWHSNEIGFHQPQVNQRLQQWWPSLQVPVGATVFVPLCGKSLDMLWLAQQGYRVLGVELSPIAVEAFFADLNCQPAVNQQRNLRCFQHRNLQILQGDFFQLTAADLAEVSAVYDRAALIALPPLMRQQYVAALQSLLPRQTTTLLLTVEYQQTEMDGPPFSVSQPEVQTAYGDWCDIELLDHQDVLSQEPRFRARGLTALSEALYRLTDRRQ